MMQSARAANAVTHRGTRNYLSGLAAEDCVVREYVAKGAVPVARRWRGRSGEVDLVLMMGDLLIFVEVKKSRTFAKAAERLSHAQLSRIMSAAEEYAAGSHAGTSPVLRIDAALVNEIGEVDIIENVSLF